MDTLRVRAEHLRRRIDEAALEGRDLSYDRAELSALEWAIPMLVGIIEANKALHEQLREEKL